MSGKERFIEIYQAHIRRPGSQRLLEYLQSPASDFFLGAGQHALSRRIQRRAGRSQPECL